MNKYVSPDKRSKKAQKERTRKEFRDGFGAGSFFAIMKEIYLEA